FAQGGGGGGGGGQSTSLIGDPIAGIDVDAAGVLRVKQFDARLAQQRLAAAKAKGDQNLMRASKLRKVSLNRLEAAIQEQRKAGTELSDDLKALAGLTAVQYVFFYPETKDVVIAGPAEGFFADQTERLVGMDSGQPTLLLEDLVTALRAYAPNSKPTSVISVSIDPTAEGLAQMNRFIQQSRRVARPSDAARIARGIKQNLGLQTVTFKGIPNSTHFARVLVEADYRMKLVGIGLERLPVNVKSYVERANPSAIAANAMERWYFQPNYDGIAVSEDGAAMRIKERGVQLVGANERVVGGQRSASGRVNRASQAFCREFTEKFNEIEKRVRIYAELRQLIDVSIAAAYIQQQDFYGKLEWNMPVLMDESQVSVETYTAPEQVETAVNAIWRGNTLMTPLGGGVHVNPRLALQSDNIEKDTEGANSMVQAKSSPSKPEQARGSQSTPGQARASPSKPEQTRASQSKPEQARA
ncbi:MAG: DUF1598 domain-containing protein, partial [Rubripirellula sp.]